MSREVMQQALEALEAKTHPVRVADEGRDYKRTMAAITALRAALKEPEQEPVGHAVIAGVLFDFMGWLTTREARLTLSSTDDASPAVEAITEFAKMRELCLDDAQVKHWQAILAHPPQRKPLTDEEIRDLWSWSATAEAERTATTQQHAFARAIERAHGIKQEEA